MFGFSHISVIVLMKIQILISNYMQLTKLKRQQVERMKCKGKVVLWSQLLRMWQKTQDF